MGIVISFQNRDWASMSKIRFACISYVILRLGSTENLLKLHTEEIGLSCMEDDRENFNQMVTRLRKTKNEASFDILKA